MINSNINNNRVFVTNSQSTEPSRINNYSSVNRFLTNSSRSGMNRPRSTTNSSSTETIDLSSSFSKIITNVDFSRISSTKEDALNGQFIDENNVLKKYWDVSKLTAEVYADGSVLLYEDGVPMGWTDEKGINPRNIGGQTMPGSNGSRIIGSIAGGNSSYRVNLNGTRGTSGQTMPSSNGSRIMGNVAGGNSSYRVNLNGTRDTSGQTTPNSNETEKSSGRTNPDSTESLNSVSRDYEYVGPGGTNPDSTESLNFVQRDYGYNGSGGTNQGL